MRDAIIKRQALDRICIGLKAQVERRLLIVSTSAIAGRAQKLAAKVPRTPTTLVAADRCPPRREHGQRVIYELSANAAEGSAFNIITNLLGGALNMSLDENIPLGNFVRLKNTLIDAIASMLSSDYRFKVLSSPSIRVRSGRQGTFSVEQEVPVLGAIQRSTDRPPLQSIEYRSSGVIFEVLPTVHEGTIELDIRQELSQFVQTRTGVSNSPTLTKRSLTTSVNLDDGDLIILGGLADEKQSERRSGPSFLFDSMFVHTSKNNRSKIGLILPVQKVTTCISMPARCRLRCCQGPRSGP